MSGEKSCEEYESGSTNFGPFSAILDDYRLRSIRKPKDDIEYGIGKMIHYICKFLTSYRVSRNKNKKKFKAVLKHKQTDELKVRTFKIRDKQSSYRAEIKILVEETIVD